MYTISKEFHFSAGHHLDGLAVEHPCSRQHGHNYIVRVFLKSTELNEAGFVRDYRALDVIKNYIDNYLDHKYLNDVLPSNPTAENIARYLFDLFKKSIPELYAIEISETPKTNARYEIT